MTWSQWMPGWLHRKHHMKNAMHEEIAKSKVVEEATRTKRRLLEATLQQALKERAGHDG